VCTRARVLCLHCYAVRVALPPFPTRRSSDLHVHAAMLRLACAVAGPDRVAMITDSISATGLSDGEYLLGPMRVRVVDGVARLVEGGSIAGSTLTMDAAFRRAVRELGLPLPEASRMTSLTPARVLGLADRIGSIAVGKQADLVVLTDDLEVAGVMKRGAWIAEP